MKDGLKLYNAEDEEDGWKSWKDVCTIIIFYTHVFIMMETSSLEENVSFTNFELKQSPWSLLKS